MRRNLPKNVPGATNLWHPASGNSLKKRYHQNITLGWDCFGTPSGIASDIYFLADCFKAALGSVLTWKGKQAGAAVGRLNQGHLDSTPCTYTPPCLPPLAPLLIWRENVALELPACSVTQFLPKTLWLAALAAPDVHIFGTGELLWIIVEEKAGLMFERDL